MPASSGTSALSIREALRELDAKGYGGEFVARPGAQLECRCCGRALEAHDVPLEVARRIEGESDPADMALVGGVRCPHCDCMGAVVLKVGPGATPEEGAILRELADLRHSHIVSHEAEETDHSLVRDTGWIRRADDE